MTKTFMVDRNRLVAEGVVQGRKPSAVARLQFSNNRRSFDNTREGDTSLSATFRDDVVEFYAEAWYEGDDCSDGSHGWYYASRTKHGEDGEEPSLRSDCGNAELKASQVKQLVARLQEWLVLYELNQKVKKDE